MYPQSQQQGYQYPQQTGYPYPQQPGYGPPPPGPSVNVNMGPQVNAPMFGGGGGGGGGWGMTEGAGMFAEKAIRQAFVSKVFTIVGCQLLATSILIAAFVLNESNKHYFAHEGKVWMIPGLIITLVTMLVLMCIESARRSTPLNFILLCVLTGGYGLVAAVISCKYSENVVLGAFAATAGSVLLLALFAKTTSFDMTGCGTTLCLLALAHMVMGIVVILVFPGSKGHLIMSVAGAMLVSLYLVFDLQLIMGGRKNELSPEEYILACVMLYTDIIQLFIYMLEIINRMSSD